MSWSAVAAAGASVVGAWSANKQSKSAQEAAKAQGQLDPRISDMLFGPGSNGQGLLGQYQGLMNAPRSEASQIYGNVNADYLGRNGATDLNAVRDASLKAMQGNSAPTSQLVGSGLNAYAVGNTVNAPGQNGLDLSGSYNSLVNGEAGNNPYLTGAIQKGINQSSNAFGNMVQDAKQATNDVLGNVRNNSVLAGQYGGSRQGLAEGRALESMNTQLGRAASQFGQNNTDAAVAAQAGAYNTDRDRQLAATQGLGAQQYGVASQDANTRNAAEFMNVGNTYDLGKFNAGLNQQTNLANQAAQLQTNATNNSSLLGGAGLLSGLNSGVSNAVEANDAYGINRAQQVNGLLAPYLASAPTQNGITSNTTNATLGGALGGLQLGSQLGGLFGGGKSTQFSGSSMGSLFDLFGSNSSFGSGGFGST